MRANKLGLLRNWQVRPDPENVGMRDAWHSGDSPGTWASCRVDEPWQRAMGMNDPAVAWYRRRVRLPARWFDDRSRVWLRFESVATDCTVWVNGQGVGRHVGDYLPFQFDITDALAGDERAEVVCRVDKIPGAKPEVVGRDPWIGHITQGFHGVLSAQHGGIWLGASVYRTGQVALEAQGVTAIADVENKRVAVEARFARCASDGRVVVRVFDHLGTCVGESRTRVESGRDTARLEVAIEAPDLWSPGSPTLYRAEVECRDASGSSSRVSDSATRRVGFRTVRVSDDGRRILLNDRAVMLRGILEWGHEPSHIAPAPEPAEVRARFDWLRSMGFNCVCLCMVYMPEWFYDIADEAGMLIWQEHPVWKSDMSGSNTTEYRRLFEGFLRRDADHPSVVLVSGACEHERFDAGLGRWWWERASALLPRTLRQVQTGFLDWPLSELSHTADEHTYENSGRWNCYLSDVSARVARDGARPLVFGETIIGADWPDLAALDGALAGVDEASRSDACWWFPKNLESFRRYEARMREALGDDALARFRAHARRFNLAIRKYQAERLRAHDLAGGWVMNHIRDVHACQCGFLDDLGQPRFAPNETLPWLGESTFVMETRDENRALVGGTRVPMRFGISNFSGAQARGISLEVDGPASLTLRSSPSGVPGDISWGEADLVVAEVHKPTRIRVEARAPCVEPNAWDLWALPETAPPSVWLDEGDKAPTERGLDFEERKYSSGWGLAVESWRPADPNPARVFPRAERVRIGSLNGSPDRVLCTTRFSSELVRHVSLGGRALLLAAPWTEAVTPKTIMLWGQCPLVVEHAAGPVLPGESDMIVDLLHHDLTRRYHRAVDHALWGSEQVARTFDDAGLPGFRPEIRPVIRCVFAHDTGEPKDHDAAAIMPIGRGLLALSTVDHSTPAGTWILGKILQSITPRRGQ